MKKTINNTLTKENKVLKSYSLKVTKISTHMSDYFIKFDNGLKVAIPMVKNKKGINVAPKPAEVIKHLEEHYPEGVEAYKNKLRSMEELTTLLDNHCNRPKTKKYGRTPKYSRDIEY